MEDESWLHLALAALATWRLTHLLAEEDGPADVIFTARQWLGSSFFGKLMDCFYCLSLWIAAPFAYLLTPHWRGRLLLWLALSGAACLLERLSHPPLEMQRISPEETGGK
jgi:hypothetical protein